MADQNDTRTRQDLLEALVAAEARAETAEAQVEILRQVSAVLTEAERRLHMFLPRRCSQQVVP